MISWTGTGQQAFSRTYSYDALNRLSTLSSPSDPSGCTGLSWSYDAWGNRTDQNLTGGSCGQFHATVNTKNQLVGPPYQYDAAGNMTNDGSHTYFYDAENRLAQVDGTFGTCSTATACYTYDALGRRVEKTTGSTKHDSIYDLSGNVVADWCTNCGTFTGWDIGYIYLNGQLAAQYSNGTTYFVHPDHLGSTRLVTGLNQAVVQNLDYLPFGELNSSNSGITTHEFTGDERDAETGLDHTWFRQYSSSLGRWMHPDPAGLAAVDPGNPQSWNRYAYVLDNPLNLIDPLGLCPPGADDCVTVTANAPDEPLTPFGGLGSGLGLGGRGFAGGGPFSEAKSDRPKHNGGSRIECATKFGQNHSLAAGIGAIFGDTVGNNFVTQLLLGNTVSSLAKIGTDIFGNTAPDARQVASMYLKGVVQGVPAPGAPLPITGPVVPVRNAVVGPVAAAAYNSVIGAVSQTLELGISASGSVATTVAGVSAQTAATTVAFAKFGLDGLTFLYGLGIACR